MLGIIRGYGIVLKSQAELNKCLYEIWQQDDVYVISQEKLRNESSISEANMRYLGYMASMPIVTLDEKNIERFFLKDISKFEMIMEQGEHFPLSMLINKFAKKHGVLTVDVHQANDFYDQYFEKGFRVFLKNIIFLILRLLRSDFRKMLKILFKYDKKLLYFILRNFHYSGYRYYKNIPDQYRFDKCFVYGDYFKRIYLDMGYNEEDVIIEGDFDLTKYEHYNGHRFSSDKPYVIYSDSRFAMELGFTAELNKLAAEVIKQGYDFYFYPHPGLDENYFKELDEGIKILPKRSINEYLDSASFVFMHVSNMLNLMIYARKKVVLLHNEAFRQSRFWGVQKEFSRNVGIPNLDINETENVIRGMETYSLDEAKYKHYLDEFCGDKEIHKEGRDKILVRELKALLEGK